MNNSKTSLFLMELIIVILFFSVSAAVCVQLFFNAHQTDVQTNRLSHAEIELQNMAECYIALDGDIAAIDDVFESTPSTDTTVEIFFDSEWNKVSENAAGISYELMLTDTSSDNNNASGEGGYMRDASITIFTIEDKENSIPSQENIILEQNISRYIPYSAK